MRNIGNQVGRSMIEMLGVLAIIGVLSVGGIAGYSKAMMKFKINKTVDEIMQLTTNIRTLYGGQRNYASLTDDVITGAKLIPDEMISDDGFINSWDGAVTIAASDKVASEDDKAFLITLNDVPKEACIELSVIDWGSSAGSGLVAMGTVDPSAVYTAADSCATGDGQACPERPMDPGEAINGCAADTNTMYWKFY